MILISQLHRLSLQEVEEDTADVAHGEVDQPDWYVGELGVRVRDNLYTLRLRAH